MIQRIQTVYLLIATAVMAVALFAPLAVFAAGGTELTLRAFGLEDAAATAAHPTIYLGILAVLACALPFATIFLYRNRMLQIRLCVVEMVLAAGCEVMMAVYYFLSCRVFSTFEFHTQSMRPAIVLPLAALIFAYLAARAIFRDELLVKSLDRIR